MYKGRAKEQYKLENGKYVAPVPIEDALCLSRFIAQAIVNGSDRPHNVALLVPDWEQVSAWAKEQLGVDAPERKVDEAALLLERLAQRPAARHVSAE